MRTCATKLYMRQTDKCEVWIVQFLFNAVALHFQRHFTRAIHEVTHNYMSLCNWKEVTSFRVKMHQHSFGGRTRWGAYTALPQADLWKNRGGDKWGGKRKEMGGDVTPQWFLKIGAYVFDAQDRGLYDSTSCCKDRQSKWWELAHFNHSGSETTKRITMKFGIYNCVAHMTAHADPCGAATTWVV